MTLRTRVLVQDDAGGRLRVAAAILPDPGPHEVVVELVASGVCHTQLATLAWQRRAPLLFGHEGLGIVLAVGAAVSDVDIGSRVLLTWLRSGLRSGGAGEHQPRPGHARLADGRRAESLNVYTWAEHCLVDREYVLPLPVEPVLGREAAVIGCAVVTGAGTVRRYLKGDAEVVAIIGVGGVGLCAVAAARAMGVSRVVAVDRRADALELASQFGATDLVHRSRTEEAPALAGAADFVVDCVGSSGSFAFALQLVRSGTPGRAGGTVALVGLPDGELSFDAVDLLRGEKQVIGSCGAASTHEDLLDLYHWVAAGHLDLGLLVTECHQLEEAASALERLEAGAVRGRALLTVSR